MNKKNNMECTSVKCCVCVCVCLLIEIENNRFILLNGNTINILTI